MVHIANSQGDKLGGGWTFIGNLKKVIETGSYEESDIYFICGPTMVQRDEVIKAKQDGKKIVLRLDNAVRNSRNRNTGMSRMKDFAQWADLVIYQSEWAQGYLEEFIKPKKSVVIINGTDLNLFYNRGDKQDNTYLYSRQNRDETKNWEMVRYWFSRRHKGNTLWIAGQFSAELVSGDFDFYKGENYRYWGSQPLDVMAGLYSKSKYFLYSYFCDACSNSLIEALASGCEVIDLFGMTDTGGAPEILRGFERYGREWLGLERMADQYKEALLSVTTDNN